MENSRIQKTSRMLYLLYSALLFIIPLAVAFYWIAFNGSDLPLPRVVERLDLHSSVPYPASTLLLGFLVTLIPASVLMFGALQLRKLFRLYSTGEFFSRANSNCLRNLSIALLAWSPARMLFDALISVLLTSSNPAGQRFVTVSLEEIELTALLLGLNFLVVAWVMGEACKLQEDHARIV